MKIFYWVIVIFNGLLATAFAYMTSVDFEKGTTISDNFEVMSGEIHSFPFFIEMELICISISIIISLAIILVIKGIIYLIKNVELKKKS